MKNKLKENCKSLFKSCIDTKTLFERRKNSFIIPIVIFVLSVATMCVPSFVRSLMVDSKDIYKQFPDIKVPLETLLTSDLNCKIENKNFTCENLNQDMIVVGDKIKYTIFINYDNSAIDASVDLKNPKDSDNYILLLKNYIKIRYVERDFINEKVNKNEFIGDYSKLEGYDLKEVSNDIKQDPSILESEMSDFVMKAYKSTLSSNFKVSLYYAFLPYFIFVLITAFMLKSPSLFKRKKGFKFSECLKISLTSSLPALIIGFFATLLFNINASLVIGLIYMVRVSYIYIRYMFSNKNNIFDELYKTTGEERFKLR